MIGSDDSDNVSGESSSETEEKEGVKTRVQTSIKPYKKSVVEYYHKMFSRKPVYTITNTGVKVEYYDITKPDTLPFDLETYRKTQIFIGSYANPWYIDVDAMKEEYADFTEKEITEIDDIFTTDYIYPSQRWKLLANQNVLEQMFVKSSINTEQLQTLLYVVIAGIALLIAVVLFG